MAQIISWHYNHYARSLSNRALFSRIFPLITLTTILVISVVKASLALSLGLVGALSIVRFRTPIKDPEELGYIFLAIAAGLGLGADRRVETVFAVIFILAAMTLYFRMSEKRIANWMYVVITINGDFGAKGQGVEELNALMRQYTISADMRRLEMEDEVVEANYFARFDDSSGIDPLISALTEKWPSANVAFSEQRQIVFG